MHFLFPKETKRGHDHHKSPLMPIPMAGPQDHCMVLIPVTPLRNSYITVMEDWFTTLSKLHYNWLKPALLPESSWIMSHFDKGLLNFFLSDRKSSFTSRLMQEVCNIINIFKVFTFNFHPPLTERNKRTVTKMVTMHFSSD